MLPPSVANASLEELQKLFVDSLKKLKARDRRIAELTAASEKSAAEVAALQGSSPQPAEASSGAPDSGTAVRLQVHDCSLDILNTNPGFGGLFKMAHAEILAPHPQIPYECRLHLDIHSQSPGIALLRYVPAFKDVVVNLHNVAMFCTCRRQKSICV